MEVMFMLASASVSDSITIMSQILEICMLICFGFSWPISVYKSWKGKTSEGKSSVFSILIIIGYTLGIASKFLKMDGYMAVASEFAGAIFIFAIIMYFINTALVSVNLLLFYIYRERDRKSKANVDNTDITISIVDEDRTTEISFETPNIITMKADVKDDGKDSTESEKANK